jgi:hypothetical protein
LLLTLALSALVILIGGVNAATTAAPEPDEAERASWWALEPAAAMETPSPDNAQRAARAAAAMQRVFVFAGFTAEPPWSESMLRYPYLWPHSHVLGATMGLAGMSVAGSDHESAMPALRRGMEWYWDTRVEPPAYASYIPPPLGQGGDVYYDDNGWAGLMLIQHFRMTGDATSLERARAVFDFMASGWDDDPALPSPGGVLWVRQGWNRDRNTVSTAPAGLMAAQLYRLTNDRSYLDWALRMYEWVNAVLRSPDGLYLDHIEPDGRVIPAVWSYNQGAMIGLSLSLYQITRDPAYLANAERTANAFIEALDHRVFRAEPPAFNALFCRYLMALYGESGTESYRAFVQRYADWLWTEARNPTTDVYSGPSGSARPDLERGVLGQAAIIQVHALLAWPREALRMLV